MKSKLLFEDLARKDNITILQKNELAVADLYNIYGKYSSKMFFSVMEDCGGIVFDNWIRLYGCGRLNVMEKNKKYNNDVMDIIIGEDIIGGLFALKDDFIYYFAPDTLKWENLNIYYTDFMSWLINRKLDLDKFYESYRWDDWKEMVKGLDLDNGISFYPALFNKSDINDRSKKIVSMDEIIGINFNL